MRTSSFPAIPGVGAPCRRALGAAGYFSLADLDGVDYHSLLALHGVGARGLERIQGAMVGEGLSLGGDVPTPEDRSGTWTVGHTGETASDIKTHAGADADLADYLDSLDDRRRAHADLLLKIFGRATGEKPVLWGPSMIGYGEAHYVYATGREGDTFRVGFSPRKAKLSLYGIRGTPAWETLSQKLGKHTTGASCVYVNKPGDIDLGVLEELIKAAWEDLPGRC